MSKLLSKNPANDEVLKELDTTPVEQLPSIFEQARQAQSRWAMLSVKQRSHALLQLRETLLNHADELVTLISQENGKPRFEALANELVPSVDLITFFAHRAPRVLKNRKISMTLMKHRSSYLQYWPLGVVAVISPWNYPFLLPWGEIIMALIAGNAVIFKPSEATPLIGLKIQELCEESGIPSHLLQTVMGDGSLGAAIIDQGPSKIFFTGSVSTGKKIMAAAAQHLIPVCLELGGKDAMIVLPDADLDYATSAALWGGFSNSGQVCASVERILLHEKIAHPFLDQLKKKISLLRQGPSLEMENDLGVITLDKQKSVYESQIQEAKTQGARFISGGEFSTDRRSLQPTIVSGEKIEQLSIYNEETFGPVVAVTTFKSVDEAIQKANQSHYGLLASIITRNLTLGERIARQLEAGTITINEVTYTAGLSETPWGGIKESGFGRKHSAEGLYEFVNVRHIHKPRSRFFVFKSFWWFPYTPYQYALFRNFLDIYRKSWVDKFRAFSHFVWNFVQYFKREKRI